MSAWAWPADAAVDAARRGWVPVPLLPGTGRPARKWANLSRISPEQVATWWPGRRYNPGICTGPSGLVVIDLDSPEHGAELPPEWVRLGVTHGVDVLAVLADRAGQRIPATYTVTTWRNGRHLYFTAPEGRAIRNSAGQNRRGIGPMIDVRGLGGLAVGAGSVRQGRPYTVADDRDPVVLPGWLAELADPPRRPVRPAGRAPRITSAGGYAAAALRGEVAILLGTRRGSRNDQLNRSAFALGQFVGAGDLAEDEVTAALLDACETCGLIADDGQRACEATIASGVAAGISQPRIRVVA